MPGRVFLDSNILVYAQDAGEPDKQRKSRDAIAALAASGDGVISTQVLQEFYVSATRKIGVPPLVAKGLLKTFTVFDIVQVSPPLVHDARRLLDPQSIVVLGRPDSGGGGIRRLLDDLQRRPQSRAGHPRREGSEPIRVSRGSILPQDLTELRAARASYAVTDGQDGGQAVVAQTPRNRPAAFGSNL